VKKYVAAFAAALLFLLASCESETNFTEDVVVNEPDIPELPPSDETIAIEDLFEPKDSIVYLYGEPHPIRLYPFGEIVKDETEGRASFAIFVENYPGYRVEQHDNLLRLTPNFDPPTDSPPMFMEITQIADITADEAEYKIKSEINFDLYELFHRYATQDFPFNSIHLYEKELSRNAKVINIYIRDNGRGGVFVITVQHSEEAHLVGTRFRHYISTLEIIDK